MNDTAVSIDEQIRSFALAVRAHLDDLPADELDEIIGGLSADLADQAADNDGVLDLGDPAPYAEELRSAAGLPPRVATRRRAPLGERLDAWRVRQAQSIRRSPIGEWLLDLLVALRPVWWVLRGYGMYVVLLFIVVLGRPRDEFLMLPDSLVEWSAVAVLVVVSVQWGRGQWLPRNALRRIRTLASVLALIALVAVLPTALSPHVEYVDDGYAPQGLLLDGVQINNIFAFDADGNPIDRVQLFTGKGTPLDLYGTAGGQNLISTENGESQFGVQDDGMRATIPTEDYRGKPVWNVYPLDEADMDPTTFQPELSTTKRPEPPFAKAPSVESTQETPTPDTGATPQPTESPAP